MQYALDAITWALHYLIWTIWCYTDLHFLHCILTLRPVQLSYFVSLILKVEGWPCDRAMQCHDVTWIFLCKIGEELEKLLTTKGLVCMYIAGLLDFLNLLLQVEGEKNFASNASLLFYFTNSQFFLYLLTSFPSSFLLLIF